MIRSFFASTSARWASIFLLALVVAASLRTKQPATAQQAAADKDDAGDLQKQLDETGTVRLSRRVYRLSKPLVVDLDRIGFAAISGDGTARLVMAGPGAAIEFRGTHAGTAAPDSFKENVWEKQRTPSVQGIEIVGAHPEADGISASGTMQLSLSQVVIRRCRHAVRLAERNRNVLIDACHFYENRGVGVYYDQVNLHQSNISGSHISYCRGGGVVVRGGDVRNIQISGCDIEGNMAADQPATANILLDCTGGSVAEVEITGCTIQHNNNSPESANIRILGKGTVPRRGEKLEFQCGHVTIGDNVMSDVKTNIHLREVRGATIVGNTLWQGYEHNMLIENSQQITIGSNMLERNPLYGYTSEADNAVIFRDCRDCTLTGVQIHDVRKPAAGLIMERCQRMNVTGCTIIDCEQGGVLWKEVTDSRLSDCLVRDDRPEKKPSPALRVIAGRGNMIVHNLFSGEVQADIADNYVTGNYGGAAKQP
jgi:hypothetical protein